MTTARTTTQQRAFLIQPDARLRDSFIEAMAEHEETDGRADADGLTLDDLREGDCVECYTEGLRDGTALRPGTDPMRPTVWWYVTDTEERGREYLGRASIRHYPVTAVLGEAGSQVWVTIRPSRRGQGLGRGLLQAALPLARAHGVHQAVVEVNAENRAALALLGEFEWGSAPQRGQGGHRFVLDTG